MTDQKCDECGSGTLRMCKGYGRTVLYRMGVPPLPVPEHIPLLMCDMCKEAMLSPADDKLLEPHLKAAYETWAQLHMNQLVSRLRTDHAVTTRVIAAALGLQEQELIDRLMGQEIADLTVIRLAELLVDNPEQFDRIQAGNPYKVFNNPKRERLKVLLRYDKDMQPGWFQEAHRRDAIHLDLCFVSHMYQHPEAEWSRTEYTERLIVYGMVDTHATRVALAEWADDIGYIGPMPMATLDRM